MCTHGNISLTCWSQPLGVAGKPVLRYPGGTGLGGGDLGDQDVICEGWTRERYRRRWKSAASPEPLDLAMVVRFHPLAMGRSWQGCPFKARRCGNTFELFPVSTGFSRSSGRERIERDGVSVSGSGCDGRCQRSNPLAPVLLLK
jgi:hypothetical protein